MKFIIVVLVIGGLGYYIYKAHQDGKPVGKIIASIVGFLITIGIWGLKKDSDRINGNREEMQKIHQASSRDLMGWYDQLDNQADHNLKVAIDQELQHRYGSNWRRMNY